MKAIIILLIAIVLGGCASSRQSTSGCMRCPTCGKKAVVWSKEMGARDYGCENKHWWRCP